MTYQAIVLCLILDSRQNSGLTEDCKNKLYCALFWIQGKTDKIPVLFS